MALAELLDLRFGDAELRESINEFLDAFRRYVHVGAKRYLALRHSRFNHVPGDHGQNAGAKAGVTAPGTPDGIAARIAQMGL